MKCDYCLPSQDDECPHGFTKCSCGKDRFCDCYSRSWGKPHYRLYIKSSHPIMWFLKNELIDCGKYFAARQN